MSPAEEARHYLPNRGIHGHTAEEFQIETIYKPNSEQLLTWLGYDGYSLEAAIVFPNLIVDADTAEVSVHTHHVRCFPPPVWTDGKEHKFLCTRGPGYRPYVLPPVLDHAFDTNRAIYIVEKQTAALLLHQNGFSVIGFDGTWGAGETRETREDGQPVKLHPVLSEFDWIGRPVYLCFDSDFRARTSVLWGMVRAYILFSVAGAVVRLIQWDQTVKGIEDYVAAKAGLDLAAQRQELDTLTATVSELSANEAAEKWIIPQYRTLFEREMAAIVPGMPERSQLAECLHEALGTTAGDLKKSWGIATKPPPVAETNTPTYPIPAVWPEPVDYSEVMYRVLSDFMNPRFVVITPEQAVVCTIHTMTTYLTEYLDDWLHFLYISAGAKESGKTRLLCLFFELCYWASLSGDPTAASIYYDLKEGPHTMLIDEVDKKEQNREAIMDLINFSTTRRTAWVKRVDVDGNKVRYFSTFCPKILAGIGRLRGTTASRCIEIQMLKKPPGGPRIRMKKEDQRTFGERRSQMIRIATEIGPGMSDYDIDRLRLPRDISDREADNWTLLFLTAELLGGPWSGLLHHSFKTLCPPKNPDVSDDSDGTEYGEALVRDLARIWIETPAVEFYPSDQLLIKLKAVKDRPWAGMRNGLGMSSEKMADLLRAFPGVKPFRHRTGQGNRAQGYFLVHLLPIFQSYAADIWNSSTPPDDPPDGTGAPPEPSGPSSEGPNPTAQNPPADLPNDEDKEKAPSEGFHPCPPWPPSGDQPPEPNGGVARVKTENVTIESRTATLATLSPSASTLERGVDRVARVKPPEKGIYLDSIPPSTPQAPFCIASHPERYTYVDLETFHPWTDNFPQPPTYTAGQLATRQREGKAHPYASDPRRCAIRLLTIHDSLGIFGPTPLTIDLTQTPDLPPDVLTALAESTLVGHNLDFDLTILRRYGVTVSNKVIDTMIASRLLGLGKSKLSFDPTAYAELSLDEVEEMEAEAETDDPNPSAHDLAATVQRYLSIRMDKASTKLGASDWGRKELSAEQLAYATEDVALLLNLWEAIARELEKAELNTVLAARMEFFPHLNQIKMTGIPVDTQQLNEEDFPRATGEKDKSAEELTQLFSGLSFEIPKSRKKKLKIKSEEGKTKWIIGPTHEGFKPSCRNQHWLSALASHGISLENTQAPTLRRADKPECWAMLKYAAAAKRLSEIVGISRSIFPDGRVRAETWNQLAAVTGRIVSRRPNLQQVPNDYRGPFRVADPWIWLKGDLEQIEMLILAVVTKDPNLLAMLLAGKDAYVEYGARIFDRKPERGPGEDQVTEKLRKIAKIPTLGTSYGMTSYGFVRQIRDELGIEYSIEEAEGFFATFFGMFPGIAAYHTRAQEEAAWRTDVRTIAGTRRWLPPLTREPSDDWELHKEYERSLRYRKNVLLNTPIQGSGADLVIWAVNQFVPQLPSGVEVINLVHDEVDLLVTKETIGRTVELITTAFREVFARFYPESPLLPSIKFSAGPSWGELEKV